VLGEFIQRRQGDRVGLIVFGSKAYIQTPLTFDRVTVKTQLEQETFIGLAGEKTAMGDAIGLAVKLLRDRPQQNRVLILLTDGSNTAGKVEPVKAAQLAKQYGVRIYTIGVGNDLFCQCDSFGECYLEKSSFELDEKTLQAIAALTSGHYFRAQDRAGLENIYHELDKYEPVKQEYKTVRPKTPLYPWLLGAAFLGSLILLVFQLSSKLEFGRAINQRIY
jgi:Ca-activated chloride channel family protein